MGETGMFEGEYEAWGSMVAEEMGKQEKLFL